MDETKQVLDQLKQTLAEYRDELAKGNSEAVQNALADFDKRFDAYEKKFDEAVADVKTAALGIGGGKAEDPARKAVGAFIRRGEVNAAMIGSSNVDGGFLIPPAIAREIIELSRPGNPLRDLAEVVTVSGSEYTFLAETSDVQGGWVGETETRSVTAGAKYAQQTVPVREVYALPEVSRALLDDADFDVEGRVFASAGRSFSKLENAGFFGGEGPKQPQGLLTVPTVADANWEYGKIGFKKSGSASAITADGLIDVQGALDDEYRDGAAWIMNKNTWDAIRKLKQGADGADKYLLWSPEIVDGRIELLLLGSRVRRSSAMPDIAANAFPVAYGDFRRAYVIVDRVDMRVVRSETSHFGFMQYYITKRVGGGVKNFEAVKFVKISA